MDEEDGGDLARYGDPAKLGQQRHILAPRSVRGPLAGQQAGTGGQPPLQDRLSFHIWRMTKM